jgi:hypothetical protein
MPLCVELMSYCISNLRNEGMIKKETSILQIEPDRGRRECICALIRFCVKEK